MPKRKKAVRAKAKRKASASRPARKYYDKFDEKEYSGPEMSVKRSEIKTSGRVLRHLEKDIVEQNEDENVLAHLDEEEDQLSEDPRSTNEGLGIEEEEKTGQEPYPEIAEAEKDPDEEEEE